MATQGSSTVLQHLHRRILDARANSDSLFQILREDSFYERPIAERHRIIFYVGHLEAFDWNLLREHLFGTDSDSPAFDQLFAFGIDPVDGGLPTDKPEDWPALPEVRQYVKTLRAQIDEALDECVISLHFAVGSFRGDSLTGRLRTPIDACGNSHLHVSPLAVLTKNSAGAIRSPPALPSKTVWWKFQPVRRRLGSRAMPQHSSAGTTNSHPPP